MRKNLLTLLFAVSIGMHLFATPEVKQIGGTDYSTSEAGAKPAPIDANQKYGLCQLLYKQSEIGSVENANITKLAFYWKQDAYAPRNVDIYITHSSLTKLTGFVNVAAANKVYSGSSTKKITMPSSAGWYEITLDSPFAWNGTDNIIITIDDNTGSWWSGSNKPSVHYSRWSNNANNVAYIYNGSSTNYDPTNASSYNATISAYSPSIKLTFEASTTVPDVPSDLAVRVTTSTSATLSWSAVSGATSYDFQQSANGSDWSDLAFGATGTSYNWTDLSAASTQYARIRAKNAVGSSDWSDAVTVTTDAVHEHDGIIFDKWSTSNALPTSGNYYIYNDVSFDAYASETITLTGNMNLCLNGNSVDIQASHIIIPDGKTLTIYDNVGTGSLSGFYESTPASAEGLITVENGGTLVIKEGSIQNLDVDPNDGYLAYAIYNKGTLRISGNPVISGHHADISLFNYKYITLDGALTNTTKYSVNAGGQTITSGWSTYMSGEKPSDYFESAKSGYDGICVVDNEAKLVKLLALDEAGSNSGISDGTYSGAICVSMTRSLTSSQYNTFCLPFALNNAQLEEIFGVGYDLREFESSSLDGEVLSLTFSDPLDALEAGKPYLLKPSVNVTNPSFEGVTISATSPADQTSDTYISFHGTYAPTELTGGNRNLLFLGAGNELFWPAADGNIKGFRAYFEVKGGAQGAKRARIVKKEEGATGIENQKSEIKNQKFLKDGQLLILRDNKTYNVLGMEYK